MPMGPVEYLESVIEDPLTPAQGFILKMIYGEAFSPGNDDIQVRDNLGQGTPLHLNEEEYLRDLRDRNRSSTDTQTSLGFTTSVLCMGRRSGKSYLNALIQFYSLHLFESIDQMSFRCLDLSPTQQMARQSRQELRDLLSEHMLLHRETATTLEVTLPRGKRVVFDFLSYRELNRIRGLHLDLVTVQELGFETDQDGRQAIEAVMPAFNQHTRLIILSTPNGRRGAFYYFYQMAMRQPNWLALRIPTWEAYPPLSGDRLQEIWVQNPNLFAGDFGADFVESELLPQPVVTPQTNPFVAISVPKEPEVTGPPPRSRYQILLEELESQQVESIGFATSPSDA